MGIKGSMLIETSILIIVVVVALVFMTNYIRRAVQGGLHDSAEQMGARYEYGGKTIGESTANFSRNVFVNVFALDPTTKRMRTETVIHNDDIKGKSNELVK